MQSTRYRVLDGSTRSTVLLERVKDLLTNDPSPTSVEDGEALTFSGAVVPASPGQPVYLERELGSGPGFHVIAEGTLDATGSYSIIHTFYGAGNEVLRIVVPADAGTDGAASEPFGLEVTPPQAETPET